MRKMIRYAASLLVAGTVLATSYSFTVSSHNDHTVVVGNIDFKVENNTGAEFKYCVNGGHNYINSGSTKSFSYPVGQDFYYIDGSSCGKQWFEVASDMQGKTYKVTDL